jgi:hypothetical protein
MGIAYEGTSFEIPVRRRVSCRDSMRIARKVKGEPCPRPISHRRSSIAQYFSCSKAQQTSALTKIREKGGLGHIPMQRSTGTSSDV